jgi:hypothetical protein
MTDAERSGGAAEELKQIYGVAYQQVSDILFTEDPIAINLEENTGESLIMIGVPAPHERGVAVFPFL